MATLARRIGDALGSFVFREVTVERVHDVSPRFRRIDVVAEVLRGARFVAGDKVQVILGEGPRTYTPFSFDASRGAMGLLAFLHGDAPTPAARWFQQVGQGDRMRIFGPRHSIAVASDGVPIILVGDETSFALGRALLESRRSAVGIDFVFEASHREDSVPALDALELPTENLVERRGDEGHLAEVEERTRSALARNPSARLVLTGKAQSIQTLRKALKARPLPHAGQTVKAYWSPGKAGLD